MSGIELKPLSDSKCGRSNFLLPLGKTVIGRGPVLGVSDKRVSRNHGVVEVEHGKLKIMSTHTNPTFYQAKGTAKLLPLAKEVWQLLEHGDRIALTPDQHVYEVVVDERHLRQSSQGPGSPVSDSPAKQTEQQTADDQSKDKNGEEDTRQEENSAGPDEKVPSNSTNHEANVDKEDGEKESDKEEAATRDEAKEDIKDTADTDQPDATENKSATVKLPDGKEMAFPLEKERKMPSWMTKLLPGTTAEEDKPEAKETTKGRGRGRPKGAAATPTPKAKRSRKLTPTSEEGSEEEYQPTRARKKTPSRSRGRGRPKGRAASGGGGGRASGGRSKGRSRRQYSDEELEEEEELAGEEGEQGKGEEEEEEEREARTEDAGRDGAAKRWGHGKTRDQATVKRRAKLALDYSEDYVASEEEEEEGEEMAVPEGDDGSDWEPESHSPRLGRSPSKGRRTSGRTGGRASGRKRAGSRRYSRQTSDDEDSDLSEEEVYIPRPTKRSGRAVSSSQEDLPKKRAKKTDNGQEKREACRYGKKCYRKNPVHREEFAHPGASDYESPRSDEDGEEKEECSHGTDGYRKNKRHVEKFKHTEDPGRPKRQATKKKANFAEASEEEEEEEEKEKEEDEGDNKEDGDESFVDDGTQDRGKDSESESWTPGDVKVADN